MTVTRIGHVGLTVTDLEGWTTFASDVVGLQVSERTDTAVHLTSSHRHTELRLTAGTAPGCDGVGLEVASAAAADAMVAAAPRFGLELVDDGPQVGYERVVRLAGATLPVLELCVGPRRAQQMPYQAAYVTQAPQPRRFGHVTFLSSDFERTSKVITGFLGFRLSDTVPGQFDWYRCNSDHHGIGLGNGPDVLHHYAWELRSFEEYRLLADHLLLHGRQLVWGPGRHGPGHNIFAYFLDPDGGMIELYTDLLEIFDEANYTPSEFTVESAGNVWGPGTVPPDAWFGAGSPFLPAGRAVPA
jgi:catechol-2,3-dioxygenase